jgi:hypothetical protein
MSARHRRSSCSNCGQIFTVHFEMEVDSATVRSRIPCLSDGCDGTIVVAHPGSAFALWLEEF